MRVRQVLCAVMLALVPLGASGMALAQDGVAPAVQPATSVARGDDAADYRLGVADKVRIIVFDEPTLSGEFTVNANGSLSLPLIGEVKALERSTGDVRAEIQARLANGYLRDPRVSMDVLTFRPYYILGEVNKPGEYPYSAGLTAINAIATAQGYTYRANRKVVFLKHAGAASEEKVASSVAVRPGDTIRIGERHF